MPDPPKLEQLLNRWIEASQRGVRLSIEQICRDQPDLGDALERKIRAWESARSRGQRPPDNEPGPFRVATDLVDLRFHAQGGLGTVYVARDQELHRQVAVKFLNTNLAHDSESQQRFVLEAELTGRLEHPGVVPLYGLGRTQDGRQFYTMRFIEGQTLDHAIRSYHAADDLALSDPTQELEFRRLLNSFVSVCKTVAYAHTRGIVHRDIKPQNVMLGRFGETLVVDWGLALPVAREERFRTTGEQTLRPESGSPSDTSSRTPAGTPVYMSPEQASGLAATPASDIYSLGATLFKLLTGSAPFQHENPREVKRLVVEGRVSGPREIRRSVPRPLESICLKAMAQHPAARYDTALELAQDVENYLADAPVSAHPETIPARLARWTRRNRAATRAALIGLVAVLVVCGFASVWLGNLAHQEQQARGQAEAARTEAEEARRENLNVSAGFLARSIAYEIDLRWRILEAEANSSELRRLLIEFNTNSGSANERFAPIQSWLDKRYIANLDAAKWISWFINSADGTQVARVPQAPSIGRNYAHRDYFHGLGEDLFPNSPAARQAVPFADKPVHMSAVYESTNTRTLMVAFSVPIFDAAPEIVQRQRIGVLCMAVELGHFAIGRDALLVDTRNDQLEHKPGLVLHHPQLGARSQQDLPPRIDQVTLQLARSLRVEQALQDPTSNAAAIHLIDDFTDPVTHSTGLAALEPVFVRGRGSAAADTGWIVIVTENPSRSATAAAEVLSGGETPDDSG